MKAIKSILFVLVVVAGDTACAEERAKRREAWTTSRMVGTPEAPKGFVSERVFKGLTFSNPVEVQAIPGTNRLAVVELGGKIFAVENRPDGENVSSELMADVRECDANFQRAFGLTFHPKFLENRYCYVSYVLKDKTPDGTRVSRFKVTKTDPPKIDLKSEEVLIRWMAGGHNGAHLQFGADGYLYISTGDAGDAFPPDGRNTGQDISDLEASILRIDVDRRDSGLTYGIPADNPFVGVGNSRGEVWAYGLRNPFKICFDPADGSLWTGDVGWEQWEMVYRVERGANYGWSVMEGPQAVQERERGPTPISPPTVAHSHIEARSVTGGYFYGGQRLPELAGAYVYGDYVTGKVWGLRHQGATVTWREELVDTSLQIICFAKDQAGELLIVDYPTGTFHRLAPNPRRGISFDFPRKLSETGLFADVKEQRPAAGVVPYQVNAEPWADGTSAERWVALPGETQFGTYRKSDAMVGFFAGDWKFPDGGVLAKTVSIELEAGKAESRRRLETQVLHFDVDTWKAYNYVWNEEGTDAVLAEDVGTERVLKVKDHKVGQSTALSYERQQTWRHASRTECLLCHTSRVGTVLGFRTPLLERDGQLVGFEKRGLFGEAWEKRGEAMPDPHDASAPLEARARAYLHVNCGHCHTRGGGGSSFFNVQYNIATAKTGLIGLRPTQGTFGILGAEVIAPGDPFRSVLYCRMSKLGHGRMPQFGSGVIDEQGTKLVEEWIGSLEPADVAASKKLEALLEKRVAQMAGFVSNPGGSEADLLELLASPSTAMMVADAIKSWDDPIVKRRKEEAVLRGYAHSDPAIRDLFERFIPEEKRVKRLGGSVQAAEILAMAGDAERGKALFFNTNGVQCKNCHRVGEVGTGVGPELTQIGKKLDRAKLLESILEPSRAIDPQFVSYLMETAEGQVLSGLLVRRNESEVVLKLADGKDVRVAVGEVERFAPQQKSLMPDLLLREMTGQQVADLIEFLAGLK